MREALRIRLLPVFILISLGVHGQQFDWVHGGGTNYNLQSPNYVEATYYLCTDPNGNIYALNEVGYGAITADTFYKSNAYGGGQNLLMTSYTCDGQMRWAKLIASNVGPCLPYGIVSDSLGHIYIAGNFTNTTLHIGDNVTVNGLQNQFMGVMQFDTLGNYNWLTYIGNNTNASYTHVTGYGPILLMGENNQPHFFITLKSGFPVTPSVNSNYGEYEFVFDQSGTQINATRLDLDSIWYLTSACLDPVNNKLYVTGVRNQYLQGVNTTYVSYAAAFDANRNKIWMDTISNNNSGFGTVAYDNMGHLYFNGASNFAAFTFNGISAPSGNVSVVLKTDTAAHPIWIQYNTINANGTNGYGSGTLTLLPNNLIAATGSFGTTLTDGIHTISNPNAGINPFLSVLDTSGVPMSLLEIYGGGAFDETRSITTDKVGNVYLGGQVSDSIWAGTVPGYETHGGNTDFFVMKYGVDCNCTSMPVANFSNVVSQFISNFTYNGTMSGIDSVTWNFGDGNTANGNNTTHSYPAVPTNQHVDYEVCVTAYTACGNDMHCSQVRINGPVSVANVLNESDIQVYPNPTKNELKIETKDFTGTYRLLNLTGACLINGNIGHSGTTVSLADIATGMYLLELKSAYGQSKMIKIVKE